MMLFEKAAINPTRLKLNSVAEQRANPLIIGSNDMFTNNPAKLFMC